jgi:hypothetical protein
MRLALCLCLLAAPVGAQEAREVGLAAWDRIFAVVSHPRCTNCHVGEEGVPMWQDLGYGEARPHGMGIVADASRIGAENVPCRTCHVTSDRSNTVPHAPPHIPDAWRLPPPELAWLGRPSAQVCDQMRDPATNDGNTMAELVAHLETSPFVAWSFDPGAGRSAPPGSVAEIARDTAAWAAAGSPCEGDAPNP